jgi:hypothetical protein
MKVLYTLAAAILLLGTSALAQKDPAMSHDHFTARMSVRACTDVAQRSMERIGYRLGHSGDTFAYGNLGQHHALVQCIPVGRDEVDVNVVVASNEMDAPVRRRQELIDTIRGFLRY